MITSYGPESPRDAARGDVDTLGPCPHGILTTVGTPCRLFCVQCGTFLVFSADERPDYQILRYDEQGLDEVLVNHCSVHIERMTTTEFWIGITRPDGKMLHVNIGTKRARVDAMVQEDELDCVSSTMGQPGYGHEGEVQG